MDTCTSFLQTVQKDVCIYVYILEFGLCTDAVFQLINNQVGIGYTYTPLCSQVVSVGSPSKLHV